LPFSSDKTSIQMRSETKKPLSIYLETLGCSKNRVDSEIMSGSLLKSRLVIVDRPEAAEIIILNTCGFIASAVAESIERLLALAEFKKTGNCEKLVVAGCLSERYREGLLKEVPEIDGLIGTSDYTKIFDSIQNLLGSSRVESFLSDTPNYSVNNYLAERALSTKGGYAYLKIAEGCSNLCSFCNIPKLRGGFRSRPLESVLNELDSLLKKGVREINLISQDTSSYGIEGDGKTNLYSLTEAILKSTTDDFWLRIFYSYPNRYPQKLFGLMRKDLRLVPYIDMPFQHFSDPVLKRMKRHLTEDQIKKIIDKAFQANGELTLRTTLMVGFPGETEKDFQKLLDWVEKGLFRHLGVFVYSDEDNIEASGFKNKIPEKIKQQRRRLLMKAQQRISKNKNRSLVGQTLKILIEGYSEETELLLTGRTRFQAPEVDGAVLISEGEAKAGEFHQVLITQAHPYDLVGKIVN